VIEPGTLVEGKYEVLQKLHEGGMGAIFKVRHVLLDEPRVMKTLRTQIQDDEMAQQRFFREAKLATSLHHPNIAVVQDFFRSSDGTFFLVMEYIEGRNLSELIREDGPPSVPFVVGVAIQALEALDYLHRKGVVHRDVSPDNFMLTRDDQGNPLVKLIDLGVARGGTSGQELTRTGVLVGKLAYMSP
jgi:serine/threonine protein kinase